MAAIFVEADGAGTSVFLAPSGLSCRTRAGVLTTLAEGFPGVAADHAIISETFGALISFNFRFCLRPKDRIDTYVCSSARGGVCNLLDVRNAHT